MGKLRPLTIITRRTSRVRSLKVIKSPTKASQVGTRNMFGQHTFSMVFNGSFPFFASIFGIPMLRRSSLSTFGPEASCTIAMTYPAPLRSSTSVIFNLWVAVKLHMCNCGSFTLTQRGKLLWAPPPSIYTTLLSVDNSQRCLWSIQNGCLFSTWKWYLFNKTIFVRSSPEIMALSLFQHSFSQQVILNFHFSKTNGNRSKFLRTMQVLPCSPSFLIQCFTSNSNAL